MTLWEKGRYYRGEGDTIGERGHCRREDDTIGERGTL